MDVSEDDNDQTLTRTLGQEYQELCDRPVGTEQDPDMPTLDIHRERGGVFHVPLIDEQQAGGSGGGGGTTSIQTTPIVMMVKIDKRNVEGPLQY